jgi:hypothetical protein
MVNEALEVIKIIGKDIYTAGKYAVIIPAVAVTLPFAVPYYSRKLAGIFERGEGEPYELAALYCGGAGAVSLIVEAAILGSNGYLTHENALPLGLAVLGTNLASGLYERVKTIRNQLREERAERANLEARLGDDPNGPNNPQGPSRNLNIDIPIRADHIIDNNQGQ